MTPEESNEQRITELKLDREYKRLKRKENVHGLICVTCGSFIWIADRCLAIFGIRYSIEDEFKEWSKK